MCLSLLLLCRSLPSHSVTLLPALTAPLCHLALYISPPGIPQHSRVSVCSVGQMIISCRRRAGCGGPPALQAYFTCSGLLLFVMSLQGGCTKKSTQILNLLSHSPQECWFRGVLEVRGLDLSTPDSSQDQNMAQGFPLNRGLRVLCAL